MAGGKSWKEVKDDDNTPYCRPLELSDTFEKPVKMPNGTYEWKVTKGVHEVQRCFATAVSIGSESLIYCFKIFLVVWVENHKLFITKKNFFDQLLAVCLHTKTIMILTRKTTCHNFTRECERTS